MPLSSTQRSPSLLSMASSTTQAAKKAVKDSEEDPEPVEEMPEQELSMLISSFLSGTGPFPLQNICKKPGNHLSMVSSRATSRSILIMAGSSTSSSVLLNDAKSRGVAFTITKT